MIPEEGQKVERKESLSLWRDIVETCAAFATPQGGKVFVGVADDGRIAGVQIGKGTLEDLASGDNFFIRLDGQDIRDRGIAGELLLRRAEKMRGANAQREIGEFAGFKLLVADNYLRGPEIVFQGASVHTVNLANTALGMTRSLEYAVQNLDEASAAVAENIKSTQKRIAGLWEQTEQPFEYAEKLAGLVQRQQEITDALDLAKNQAPNQLDSKSAEAEAEAQSESQTEATTRRNGQTQQHSRGARVGV